MDYENELVVGEERRHRDVGELPGRQGGRQERRRDGARQLDPRGAAKRAAMEQEMGHTISMAGTPFTEIIAEAERLTAQGVKAVPVPHIG